MKDYNSDLHIHSPHSIAVSQSLNLDTMLETARLKGLHLLGTGDILQPEWLKYMETNLDKKNGTYSYKELSFILQSEIEDENSVHHLVFFQDFDSVREIQKKLDPYSKNITNEWGGRPRVNISAAEIVDIISDSGGIIGPAHAFTPFRAIFRQNKFKTLKECYEDSYKKVLFLELGLSANTDLADRIESLHDVSFLSNSDAHSQNPRSLGREFNKISMEEPNFEELLLALKRKDNRKITLNLGLHPKLGKYYKMFCGKCRRRVLFKNTKKNIAMSFSQYSVTENFIIFFENDPKSAEESYIDQVANNKITCPACKDKYGKNYKIKLGVSERVDTIATFENTQHPNHRPKYINAIPLYDVARAVKGIKSTSSKTVDKLYNKLINTLGPEYDILLEIPIEEIEQVNKSIASVIDAFRNDEIEYVPGGGGTYGGIKFESE
ncbi:MAG: DNA helicase II [Promethearchaeota archaeon]|nr:MAG: DNA helicase II [Candidatus Lokiarchaeota archaeon]